MWTEYILTICVIRRMLPFSPINMISADIIKDVRWISGAGIISPRSVSYTHLDVYKRQELSYAGVAKRWVNGKKN